MRNSNKSLLGHFFSRAEGSLLDFILRLHRLPLMIFSAFWLVIVITLVLVLLLSIKMRSRIWWVGVNLPEIQKAPEFLRKKRPSVRLYLFNFISVITTKWYFLFWRKKPSISFYYNLLSKESLELLRRNRKLVIFQYSTIPTNGSVPLT